MRLLLALLATPAMAQDAPYLSGEGHAYALASAKGGVTLTSTDPVPRQVGSATMDDEDTLTLRPDCTAEADGASGTWGQANGGFLVTLPGRTVGFPRQELEGLDVAACPLE